MSPVVFWAFLGVVGAIINGLTGGLIGLAIGLGLTLLAECFR